jgi:endonuclease/exonuclease/phosphatase family metal-dependent hydrolase
LLIRGLLATGIALAAAVALPFQEPQPVHGPQPVQEPAPVVVRWQDAGEHVGERVTVTGTIVDTHNSGRVVFLNYHRQWRGKFRLVVFPDAWPQFPEPPEDLFRGKEVRVSGMVEEYQGAPQIVIESVAQVRWADGTPVAAAGVAASPLPEPGARAEGVRVLTWNVENLFDAHDDPYRDDEGTRVAADPERRLRGIAAVLRRVNADVVCLQEVENRGVLEDLNDRLLGGLGYEAVLFEGNDGRGIDVAMLTRLPVLSATSYRHLRFPGPDGLTRFRRDLLRVELGPPLDADVYLVHLKSKAGGGQADAVRLAEARTASAILGGELEVNPDYRALVAGDFNDVADSPALRTFSVADLRDPLAGSDAYSYHPERYRSRIDFMLLTRGLAAELDDESARVVSSLPGVRLETLSDHYPVVLELTPPRRR